MEEESFIFRRFLYQISNHLGPGDVGKLKFLLDTDIPRAELERALTGFDIFCLMEEKNLLSPNDLEFLKDILETVGKVHYITKYQSDKSRAKQIPTNSSIGAREHKKLLTKLGDGMTPENVRDMALFFHGGPSSIHVKELMALDSAVKIFKKLESSGSIKPGDYSILYSVLEVMGRQDLCDVIADFCSQPPSTPQRDNLASPMQAEGEAEAEYPHTLPSLVSSGSSLLYSPTTASTADSLQTTDTSVDGVASALLVGSEAKPIVESVHRLQEKLGKAVSLKHPTAEQGSIVRELEGQLRAKISEVAQLRKANAELAKVSRPPSYAMEKTPHGIAMIIVNEKFDPNPEMGFDLPKREGARKDKELFTKTFQMLNYQVEVQRDRSGAEMFDLLDQVAKQDHTDFDSFVCCVSTHGNVEGLYGSDGILVKWQELHNAIQFCQSLRGKPKLFFFQSCRKPLRVTADGTTPSAYHEDSDIFKVFAATPNNEAYISPEFGSWLASSMSRHLTNPQLIYSYSLQELMNFVCEEVDRQVGLLNEGGVEVRVQQCVQIEHTLTKAVYFFPQN